MTGPLAPLFAQVRTSLDTLHYYGASERHTDDQCPVCGACDEGLAALSSIERHVQDMEKALRAPVGFIEALALGQYAASEPTLRAARIYAPQARAALPAREKEEETK